MKRTLNYTGRSGLPKSEIEIYLNRGQEKVDSFEITMNLDEIDDREDIEVIVEAYHRSEVEEFNLGNISNVKEKPKIERSLGTIGHLVENITFRVLLVDDEGRIISLAEKIKAKKEESEPLLPVNLRDIGREVWELRYEGNEGAPELLVNKKISSIKSTVKSDYRFILGVYPEVLRSILARIIYYEEVGSVEDIDRTWINQWLSFADDVSNVELPDNLEPRNNNHKTKLEKWLDQTVSAFAESRNSEWQKMREGW